MNLDDLKQTWRDEMNTFNAKGAINFEQIKHQADCLDKKMAMSVRLEIYACIALFIALGLMIVFIPEWNLAMQISYAIMAFMCLYIPYRLLSARRAGEEDNWTLRNRINMEIAKLEKQGELINSVAWWYLMPLSISVLLGSWGGYALRTKTWVPDAGLWTYWGIVTILYIGILILNRRARATKIQPILERLREIREQLSNMTDEKK